MPKEVAKIIQIGHFQQTLRHVLFSTAIDLSRITTMSSYLFNWVIAVRGGKQAKKLRKFTA